MEVSAINDLSALRAAELFRSCCGSSRWVAAMVDRRPFASREAMLHAADEIWRGLQESDWQEAFRHHPRIGEQQAAAPQSTRAAAWSAGEQRGADAMDAETRRMLQAANQEYEHRFGYVYIVFATGKSAKELLAIARSRLANSAEPELFIAAGEQQKITHRRLEKVLEGSHGIGGFA